MQTGIVRTANGLVLPDVGPDIGAKDLSDEEWSNLVKGSGQEMSGGQEMTDDEMKDMFS